MQKSYISAPALLELGQSSGASGSKLPWWSRNGACQNGHVSGGFHAVCYSSEVLEWNSGRCRPEKENMAAQGRMNFKK